MNTQEECPRVEELSALSDDALRGEERVALESHVAGCAICAPYLAELRGLRAAFAALPDVSAGFDGAREIDRRIAALGEARGRRSPRATRPRWRQVAMLAPGGAAAVALGVWLGVAAMPAAVPTSGATAAQMAAFAALPPGAVCPAPRACGRAVR